MEEEGLCRGLCASGLWKMRGSGDVVQPCFHVSSWLGSSLVQTHRSFSCVPLPSAQAALAQNPGT